MLAPPTAQAGRDRRTIISPSQRRPRLPRRPGAVRARQRINGVQHLPLSHRRGQERREDAEESGEDRPARFGLPAGPRRRTGGLRSVHCPPAPPLADRPPSAHPDQTTQGQEFPGRGVYWQSHPALLRPRDDGVPWSRPCGRLRRFQRQQAAERARASAVFVGRLARQGRLRCGRDFGAFLDDVRAPGVAARIWWWSVCNSAQPDGSSPSIRSMDSPPHRQAATRWRRPTFASTPPSPTSSHGTRSSTGPGQWRRFRSAAVRTTPEHWGLCSRRQGGRRKRWPTALGSTSPAYEQGTPRPQTLPGRLAGQGTHVAPATQKSAKTLVPTTPSSKGFSADDPSCRRTGLLRQGWSVVPPAAGRETTGRALETLPA